jgi:hypothetical protein
MKTIVLIVALIHFNVYSQNYKWICENKNLLTCDTCKSKPQNYLDEYLIDSISKQPFTGIAVFKTDFFIDSVNFYNGMKSGISKFTYLKEIKSFTYTYFLSYGFISNHYHMNTQKKVVFFFRTEGINYYYKIKFKKNNIKMKVKLTFGNNKQECHKIIFKNYENYNNYFKFSIVDDLYLKMDETRCFIKKIN